MRSKEKKKVLKESNLKLQEEKSNTLRLDPLPSVSSGVTCGSLNLDPEDERRLSDFFFPPSKSTRMLIRNAKPQKNLLPDPKREAKSTLRLNPEDETKLSNFFFPNERDR